MEGNARYCGYFQDGKLVGMLKVFYKYYKLLLFYN
jgi:hypothetical protein